MLNFMVKLWGLDGKFLTFLLNVRLQCKVYLKFVCIKGSMEWHSIYIFPNLTGSPTCCQDVPARPAADDVREGLGRGRLRGATRSAQLGQKYLNLKKRIL